MYLHTCLHMLVHADVRTSVPLRFPFHRPRDPCISISPSVCPSVYLRLSISHLCLRTSTALSASVHLLQLFFRATYLCVTLSPSMYVLRGCHPNRPYAHTRPSTSSRAHRHSFRPRAIAETTVRGCCRLCACKNQCEHMLVANVSVRPKLPTNLIMRFARWALGRREMATPVEHCAFCRGSTPECF